MKKKHLLKIGIIQLLACFFLFSCATIQTNINGYIREMSDPQISNNEGSMKKERIRLFRPSDNSRKNIHILGTIHMGHFNYQNKYSLADVQSVIDVIRPDLLLVEVRQETFDKYGVLDGPPEMIFAWCYSKENGIDVKGIDWWHPSLGLPNTTSMERDDHIFNNIISANNNYENILVLIGYEHLQPQEMFFMNHGYLSINITNKENYFEKSDNMNFVYPKNYEIERKKQNEYFKNTFLYEIYAIPEDNPFREAWIKYMTRNKEQ